MAASVTLLLWMFRDLGLGVAVVQADKLDEGLCTALLWIQIAIGFALALGSLAAAPLAAAFYHEPALLPLLAAMSVSFVFIGVGGLPRAFLMRELRFHELNRIDTISAVVATAAMIASASFGAGRYAFVVFLLISEFISGVLPWRYHRWRPKASPRADGLLQLVRVGLHLTHFYALNFLSKQIETFAVGRFFGAQPLGLYTRAGQMLNLPLQHAAEPLTQVTLGALARSTTDIRKFNDYAIIGAKIVAHLTLPVSALAIAVPELITQLVLGPQWIDAAPLLRWFGVSAALNQTTLIAQAVAIAAGHSRRLAVLASATLPILIAAILLGARWGAIGVAVAIALANATLAWPRLWWRLRGTSLSVRRYLSALQWPLVTAAALAAGACAGQRLARDQNVTWQIVATLAAALIVPIAAGVSIPPLRRELRAIRDYLVDSRRATKPPTSTAARNDARSR
jgi:PST family polysaccharide transporter